MKRAERTFIPGSKWVYLKLYIGTKTADHILTQYISSIINVLYKMKLIEKWFFIRYSDGDFHLRIRILLKEDIAINGVLSLFYKKINPMVKNRLVWKIQLDTYNRELERYGNEMIEEAETIFSLDSDCIVAIIKKLRYKDENYRWMIALKMIDSLLSDFSLELDAKQDLMQELSLSFKKEFNFHEHNSKQFNTKYREHKITVEKVLKEEIENEDFKILYPIISKKSKRMRPIVLRIKTIMRKKQKNVTLYSLLGSYIHMMLNRLFRSKNRMHELVLYDFMNRYYKSEIAKNNTRKP
jgi:thiopeptide-type bacteriocin biosynthesis protein